MSENASKKVLVTGATGQVGGAVIAHLSADKSVEVFAAARNPKKAAALGVRVVYLRPQMFMQNLLGYGGESFIKQGVILQYIGEARLSWVDCDDVAALAAAALLHPERHHAKTYRLGFEAKNYIEIAETMTEVLHEKFRYEARPPEEFLQKVLAAGRPRLLDQRLRLLS